MLKGLKQMFLAVAASANREMSRTEGEKTNFIYKTLALTLLNFVCFQNWSCAPV